MRDAEASDDSATGTPRWFTEFASGYSEQYVARFRRLAADGVDVVGEARFVDCLVRRRARILDAGCGPGRIGAELAARGHTVVGVDVDPVLVAAAAEDHPGPRWIQADLARLALDQDPVPEAPFDLAVLAGNVMVYLVPGSEATVLARVAAHVRPGGYVVTGFALDREYGLDDFDRDCDTVGLDRQHRFAGWSLEPWHDRADWAVTVLRR